MKRIIDIDEDYYEMLKYNVENGQKYKPWEIIVNGTLYEERPQGEWQYTTHHARRYRICPFCKCEKEDDRSAGWFYCWHCGAEMKGGAENG